MAKPLPDLSSIKLASLLAVSCHFEEFELCSIDVFFHCVTVKDNAEAGVKLFEVACTSLLLLQPNFLLKTMAAASVGPEVGAAAAVKM